MTNLAGTLMVKRSRSATQTAAPNASATHELPAQPDTTINLHGQSLLMSDTPTPPALPETWTAAQTGEVAAPIDWQGLPASGAWLAAIGGGFSLAIPFAGAGIAAAILTNLVPVSPWVAGPVAGLLGAAYGAWLGFKRHQRTLWKLDNDGFALQRGRWWQTESRVPISRVQHLDLKRGPLERAFGLATLVIHTAGTRMAAVSVSGLRGEDAERLRDRLARQLDNDDDAL